MQTETYCVNVINSCMTMMMTAAAGLHESTTFTATMYETRTRRVYVCGMFLHLLFPHQPPPIFTGDTHFLL